MQKGFELMQLYVFPIVFNLNGYSAKAVRKHSLFDPFDFLAAENFRERFRIS